MKKLELKIENNMKISEFRKLIREEIKSILSERATWHVAYDWANSELGKSYSSKEIWLV